LNDASGGSYFGISSTGTVDDNQWHHIVAVFDGTEEYLYIDGVLDSRGKALGNTIAQTYSAASIGENTDAPGRIWDGRISEVAIFTNALNQSQIQQVYNAAAPSPVLTQQPQVSTPVYEGSTLSSSVTAIGGRPMIYQWTKNSAAIPGQSSSVLIVSNVTAAADNGIYAVVVTNAFGAITSSMVSVSVVAAPPVILEQPASVVLAPGGDATFTVLAGGSWPMSYQWTRNSSPIAGATQSALTLSPVQPAEAGTYSVTLTNRHGSTNSTLVTLSLAPVSDWQALMMALGPYTYWQLNETSGTVASDVSSGLDGVIVGNMVLGAAGARPSDGFAGFGGAHQAFQFDGATSFVNCGTQVDLNVTSHTILTWVKSQPFIYGGHNAILTKGDSSYRVQRAYSGEFLEDTDDGINPATIGVRYLIGTRPVDDGTWHMITCVLDQGVRSLYFDGSLDVSGAGYGTTAIAGYPVYIGENAQAPGRVWPGWISDVALFNRALSAAEIAGLWQFALNGASAPGIGTQPVSQDVFVGQPVTFSVSAVAGSAPFGYQWRKDGTLIAGATSSVLFMGSAGYADAGNYDVVVTNQVGSVTSLPATLTIWPPATFANLTNGLVLHLKFDGDFTDSSGLGNNGIPGGSPAFVPGKIGQAVHVGSYRASSAYNYVAVPYSPTFGFDNDFSVSLWVRYTGLPNDLPMIGNATGSTYFPGWVLTDDTGKLERSLEAINTSGARIADPVSGSPVLNDGNWHQIVMVVSYSGDALTNYVDGVCVDVSPLGPLTNLDTSGPIVIGQDPSGTYSSFGGASAEYDIDDVGIWARALSQIEAESIYAAGQYGQSFDGYGPVVLRIQSTPAGVLVLWSAGTLVSADDPAGPWLPVIGSSPPAYQVTPLTAKKFYRVQL
jgi:hypothetical protein